MILEIGTSDFRTQAGQVDGVFVEPVKYYFDRISSGEFNANNEEKEITCHYENVAISNKAGTIEVFYLTDAEIDRLQLPAWSRGCNSINKVHPTIKELLRKRGISEDVVKRDRVPVVRIKSIIDKYNIIELDHLKIDTEGHDTIILNDFLDTVDFLPNKITFENNVLSIPQNVREVCVRLEGLGYELEAVKDDIVCTLKR